MNGKTVDFGSYNARITKMSWVQRAPISIGRP
jgi:hypothetical protein